MTKPQAWPDGDRCVVGTGERETVILCVFCFAAFSLCISCCLPKNSLLFFSLCAVKRLMNFAFVEMKMLCFFCFYFLALIYLNL